MKQNNMKAIIAFFRTLFAQRYETTDRNRTIINIRQVTRDMEADGWRVVDIISFDNGIYNVMYERRIKKEKTHHNI